MFKFKRSRRQKYKDINFLCLEISDDLDDISADLDELYKTVKESYALIIDIQDQCQQIIKIMEKNNGKKERTLEEIVDNIEKIVGKDNARE